MINYVAPGDKIYAEDWNDVVAALPFNGTNSSTLGCRSTGNQLILEDWTDPTLFSQPGETRPVSWKTRIQSNGISAQIDLFEPFIADATGSETEEVNFGEVAGLQTLEDGWWKAVEISCLSASPSWTLNALYGDVNQLCCIGSSQLSSDPLSSIDQTGTLIFEVATWLSSGVLCCQTQYGQPIVQSQNGHPWCFEPSFGISSVIVKNCVVQAGRSYVSWGDNVFVPISSEVSAGTAVAQLSIDVNGNTTLSILNSTNFGIVDGLSARNVINLPLWEYRNKRIVKDYRAMPVIQMFD